MFSKTNLPRKPNGAIYLLISLRALTISSDLDLTFLIQNILCPIQIKMVYKKSLNRLKANKHLLYVACMTRQL